MVNRAGDTKSDTKTRVPEGAPRARVVVIRASFVALRATKLAQKSTIRVLFQTL